MACLAKISAFSISEDHLLEKIKEEDRIAYGQIKYINDFGSITSYQAYADLGVTQLGTRIKELKAKGYEFKTEQEGVCENEVLGVNITAPYSLVALEEAMPDTYYNYGQFEYMGWYAMCAEIETAKPEGKVFMNTYKASYLVTANMDEIKADVCSYATPRSCLFVGENNTLYIMCAVAMDYKGNLSEMYVSEPFSYSASSTSYRNINELLDKLGLEPEVQAEPGIKMLSL